MRIALVDNSTLTSVQRLLGQIPVSNKYQLDGDIAAFESFIQAILFYDQVWYLDDYKEQYKELRRQFFGRLFPYQPSATEYSELTAATKSLTDNIIPRVTSGKLTDRDFAEFFRLLQMNLTFTWDLSSSEYFLTVKMLGGVGGSDLEQHSKIFSQIIEGLKEGSETFNPVHKSPILIASNGNVVDNNYRLLDSMGIPHQPNMSRQTSAFFAGLSWLAFRTTFYTLIAEALKVDLVLHPVRDAFQANILSKMNVFDPSTYKGVIQAINNEASDTFNKVLGPSQPFILKQSLPLFTAWLAKTHGNPQEFVEIAYSIRTQDQFVRARQQLIELEDTIAKGEQRDFAVKTNKLLDDVKKSFDYLTIEYGVKTSQGFSTSAIVSVYNLIASVKAFPKVKSQYVV